MVSPIAFVRGIRHPEAFHGAHSRAPYFEGWYVKLVDESKNQRWAVIPGIFRGVLGETGIRNESFVQVLDGATGRSWFHRYDIDDFAASTSSFDVRVGGNHFSPTGVTLDLPQLSGELRFASELQPWPMRLLSPGIMGWYAYVPLMECYHGIVSFGHALAGNLSVEGQRVSFDGGRGYIEKDWGTAFPAGYVWLHSNHFEADQSASFIGSVAIIPWRRSKFRGFIVGLRHSDTLYRWATYTRARESQLTIEDTHVYWSLEGRDGRLDVHADRVRGGLLHAPLRTQPHQRVEETLDARILVRHSDSSGRVLFESTGEAGGMEVFGDIPALLGTPTRGR